eukprot:3268737-Rhodomonas_salina.1
MTPKVRAERRRQISRAEKAKIGCTLHRVRGLLRLTSGWMAGLACARVRACVCVCMCMRVYVCLRVFLCVVNLFVATP